MVIHAECLENILEYSKYSTSLFKEEEKGDGQRLKKRNEHNIALLFEGTVKRSRTQGKPQSSKHHAIIVKNLTVLGVTIINALKITQVI